MDWLSINFYRKINRHYNDSLLYRFLYSFCFSLDDTYNAIKNHEEWLNNPSTF